MSTTDDDDKKESGELQEPAMAATKPEPGSDTQVFRKIGMFEAALGNVVLRGRRGQRDMVFPLDKAVKRYYYTISMMESMLRTGIRGWDTMKDIADELKGKIREAVAQRHQLAQPVPPDAENFILREFK